MVTTACHINVLKHCFSSLLVNEFVQRIVFQNDSVYIIYTHTYTYFEIISKHELLQILNVLLKFYHLLFLFQKTSFPQSPSKTNSSTHRVCSVFLCVKCIMLSFPFLFKIFPCCIIFTLRCSFCIICMEFLYIILPFMSLNSRLCSLSASNLIVFWGFCVVHFFHTLFVACRISRFYINRNSCHEDRSNCLCIKETKCFVMVFTSCSTTNFDSRESLYSTCSFITNYDL